MFFPDAQLRVWLYGEPVDMRKSYDGLYALARHGLKQDPQQGALFAFVNRRGTQIKVLYYDRNGWCIWAQRLEAGRFIGDWRGQVTELKRQLFGSKSERFAPTPNPLQMHLGQLLGEELPVPPPPAAGQRVPAHTRRKPRSDMADDGGGAAFFDEAKVPVKTIVVANPETQGLSPDQYEVIGEKTSLRLAQRPGSYVVLKYVRPVIKRRDTQTLHCAPAPAGVIEGSRAHVSFIAGLIVDKFCWHLPLYRQHQRLLDAGFKLSRPWLAQLVQQGVALLEPIHDALKASVLVSRGKAMDETPIKAGRAGPGKMKATYFWPIYGEHDEVCFPHFESRRHEHVQQTLGLDVVSGGGACLEFCV